MNFSKEVHQIKTDLYTDTRLKSLFYGYLLDEKASKRNPWEELYTEGETALPKLLTDAQQKSCSTSRAATNTVCNVPFRSPSHGASAPPFSSTSPTTPGKMPFRTG